MHYETKQSTSYKKHYAELGVYRRKRKLGFATHARRLAAVKELLSKSNIMKKVFLIAAALFVISACKKRFEEGQGNCLTSANKRMAGYWELDKFYINNIDSVEYYNLVFKGKCVFKTSIGNKKSDTNALSFQWGTDSNSIKIGRLWYGNAKSNYMSLSNYNDTLPHYFLYPFSRYWCDYYYEIRYLSKKKLVLQIKPNDKYIQRLEFIKI